LKRNRLKEHVREKRYKGQDEKRGKIYTISRLDHLVGVERDSKLKCDGYASSIRGPKNRVWPGE